jgi:hypothetical protein
MKARRLVVTPEMLVMLFSNSRAMMITKHRLPEDAKLVRADVDSRYYGDPIAGTRNRAQFTIYLWIESAVFKDDDPDDLPPIQFTAIAL